MGYHSKSAEELSASAEMEAHDDQAVAACI